MRAWLFASTHTHSHTETQTCTTAAQALLFKLMWVLSRHPTSPICSTQALAWESRVTLLARMQIHSAHTQTHTHTVRRSLNRSTNKQKDREKDRQATRNSSRKGAVENPLGWERARNMQEGPKTDRQTQRQIRITHSETGRYIAGQICLQQTMAEVVLKRYPKLPLSLVASNGRMRYCKHLY